MLALDVELDQLVGHGRRTCPAWPWTLDRTSLLALDVGQDRLDELVSPERRTGPAWPWTSDGPSLLTLDVGWAQLVGPGLESGPACWPWTLDGPSLLALNVGRAQLVGPGRQAGPACWPPDVRQDQLVGPACQDRTSLLAPDVTHRTRPGSTAKRTAAFAVLRSGDGVKSIGQRAPDFNSRCETAQT